MIEGEDFEGVLAFTVVAAAIRIGVSRIAAIDWRSVVFDICLPIRTYRYMGNNLFTKALSNTVPALPCFICTCSSMVSRFDRIVRIRYTESVGEAGLVVVTTPVGWCIKSVHVSHKLYTDNTDDDTIAFGLQAVSESTTLPLGK